MSSRWVILSAVLAVALAAGGLAVRAGRAASPESQATAALKSWEQDVESGGSGKRFWSEPKLADQFFAVRSCKILSVSTAGGGAVDISARIESSNRAGLPIVANWTFFMSRNPGGEWKIDILTEQ